MVLAKQPCSTSSLAYISRLLAKFFLDGADITGLKPHELFHKVYYERFSSPMIFDTDRPRQL